MTFAPPLLVVAACAILLGACAGYSPSDVVVGQSEGDVARSMGAPTGRYALPGGSTRLEYARGPYARHTYMIDVDAAGRVAGWRQVLTEANFLRVLPGMSRHDLLLLLGRPGEVFAVPWQKGEVWNYRYATNDCLWFQVTVTFDGVVKDAGHGIDPRCAGPTNRRTGSDARVHAVWHRRRRDGLSSTAAARSGAASATPRWPSSAAR